MDQKEIFLIIIGMMLVTYGPRLLPILVLSSQSLRPGLAKWLGLIPAAVLAALLSQGLLAPEGDLHLSFDNYFLWAALATLLVSIRGRSFVLAILTGMAVVALLRYLG